MRPQQSLLRLALQRSKTQRICRRRYGSSGSLIDTLSRRGLLAQLTHEQLDKDLQQRKHTVYLGVDPTAKALHVGNLLPFMCLLHFHLRGHKAVALVGGATGRVGDPSGKSEERKLLRTSVVDENVNDLRCSVKNLFKSATSYASRRLQFDDEPDHDVEIVNNLEWFSSMNLLDFLAITGKFARVQTMMNRDSVRIRMASQSGISFTEFAYQLLQAHDFYHLHRKRGCSIQIGGSDQWGNILAGIDLIERKRNASLPSPTDEAEDRPPSAYGLTTPLLTTASGAKFGKSEGNAVWLDEKMTSVFDFYQFFMRIADEDVEKYLRMLTFAPLDRIESVMNEHHAAPEIRVAQRLLADEVTEMIHGSDGLGRARVATKILFDMSLTDLRAEDIVCALASDPRLQACNRDEAEGELVTKLASRHGLVNSGGEARRLAAAKGLYLNNNIVDPKQVLRREDLIDERVVVLRAGKNKHLVLDCQP